MTKVIIIAHRPLTAKGGGEKSMGIIAHYLKGEGYNVQVWHEQEASSDNGLEILAGPMENVIDQADVVISWGNPALQAYNLASEHSKPFILCVRWWRNVIDIRHEIGNLMARSPDNSTDEKRAMFAGAAAVITNNFYAAGVIERFYGRQAIVSYVPILGEANDVAHRNGYIVAISPDKGIGEELWVKEIAKQMGHEDFLVVNPAEGQDWKLNNIEVWPYAKCMLNVWSVAKAMIQPVYFNDICGTLRATIEAQQHGVPVIANNRCGMSEKIPNLVSYDADYLEWCAKIQHVNRTWEERNAEALRLFAEYDTPGQLEIFKHEIEKCANVLS